MHDHAAGHFRNILEPVAAAAQRADGDDVTGLQRTGNRIDLARGTVRETDFRTASAGAESHGDLPVVIVGADEGRGQALRPLVVDLDPVDRPAPALAAAVAQQSAAQRVLGIFLQFRVQRRAHPQAARIDAVGTGLFVFAEFLDQLAPHFLNKIAANPFEAGAGAGDRAERLGRGSLELRGGDPAIVAHLSQHPVAPADRPLLVDFGTIVGRSLWQDRQIGNLVQRQRIDILAEIGLGRSLHAIGVATEKNLVEIEFEYLFLGQHILDPVGQDRLAHLPPVGDFAAQQQILRDLLGDGGGTDRAAAVGDVGQDRGRDAGIIQAAMFKEGPVLGGQIGAYQQRRIFGELQLHAPLAGVAVHGRQRRLVDAERVRIRQVAGKDQPDKQPAENAQS